MPANGDPGATPAVPGATPDSTTDPQPAPATGAGTPDGLPPDLGEAGKAAIERERESRREAEKTLKAAQAELAQAPGRRSRRPRTRRSPNRSASPSGWPRPSAAAASSKTQLREQRLRSAVLSVAGRLSDEPEILLALLDRDAVEWAEDGTPKGLERQLRSIVEAHPKLARTRPRLRGRPARSDAIGHGHERLHPAGRGSQHLGPTT